MGKKQREETGEEKNVYQQMKAGKYSQIKKEQKRKRREREIPRRVKLKENEEKTPSGRISMESRDQVVTEPHRPWQETHQVLGLTPHAFLSYSFCSVFLCCNKSQP